MKKETWNSLTKYLAGAEMCCAGYFISAAVKPETNWWLSILDVGVATYSIGLALEYAKEYFKS